MIDMNKLLPCPFCGGKEFEITENGKVWTGKKYSEPTSVSVRHWCDKIEGQPSRMIERVGRDADSAVSAWNMRYDAKVLEDKEREVDELKELVAKYDKRNCELQELAFKRNAELQSHINDLREALEEIANTDPEEGTHWFHSKSEQALSKTPAQSLTEHDAKVIEKYAKERDDEWPDYGY